MTCINQFQYSSPIPFSARSRETALKKSESSFPTKAWSPRDWVLFCALAIVSCMLFWSGLSVRSLWGPEGHWAMIVREMLRSGNYFVPTVNGMVDLDKPLLSYWAVLPFAWTFGLTESILRIPGTLAAIGLVLLVFAIGRRLFGSTAGIVAALLLLASPMFVLWGRTASADLLNTLAIWAVFWVFLAGASDGRLGYLVLLYGIGAVGSFVKGPVAPAVSLSSLGLYSCVVMLLRSRSEVVAANNGSREHVFAEFSWLTSRRALVGLLVGVALFVSLLLVHAVSTGSWTSLSLMWKENVVRFFAAFDHEDPPYVYLTQIAFFCAPWSFFLVASLCTVKLRKPDRQYRWVLLSALGILLFFTISCSRRSYYILPLIPALALITGKALADWIDSEAKINEWIMRVAALVTSLVVGLVGIGLIYVYLTMEIYRDVSSFLPALVAVVGSAGCLFFFMRKRPRKGLVVMLIAIFVFEIWGFTRGMELAERKRTLKGFAKEVTNSLSGVRDDKIFIFQHGTASLLFYLNRPSAIKNVDSVQEIGRCAEENPDGFLIIDLREARTPEISRSLHKMRTVYVQNTDVKKDEERFALLKFH